MHAINVARNQASMMQIYYQKTREVCIKKVRKELGKCAYKESRKELGKSVCKKNSQ